MSSPQGVPSWLVNALSSEKHITSVLRVLSDREYNRDVGRNASRLRVLGQNESSSQNRQFPLSFLVRRNKDAPPSHVEHYAITAGSLVAHQNYNRYIDITPYDRSRVVVYDGHLGYGGEHTLQGRYLNANWVLERGGQKWWIATQAPVIRSAHTFLSSILKDVIDPPYCASYRSRIRTVVQLTRDVESGRRKADAYFPSQVGQSLIVHPEGAFGVPLKVTLHDMRTIDDAHCIERIVSIHSLNTTSQQESEIADGGEDNQLNVGRSQTVAFKHLLYDAWPDHGVPEDHHSLLSFIRLVDNTNRGTLDCLTYSPSTSQGSEEVDPDPPIIVGCSAGIGRTGSFIALCSMLRKYGFISPPGKPTHPSLLLPSPLGPIPEDLQADEVAQEIDSLREQRPGMVQRPEQVLLVYEVLAKYFGLQTV